MPEVALLEPVYPRVGGGTVLLRAWDGAAAGLSPRGRGNRTVAMSPPVLIGSIPAWAGEPSNPVAPIAAIPVYPRVGGGTITSQLPRLATMGLSPRGRGNRVSTTYNLISNRSIPAWAGEPFPRHRTCPYRAVYPRVGGGTTTWGQHITEAQGLSPRGRGNPLWCLYRVKAIGSIPAWAGEPTTA